MDTLGAVSIWENTRIVGKSKRSKEDEYRMKIHTIFKCSPVESFFFKRTTRSKRFLDIQMNILDIVQEAEKILNRRIFYPWIESEIKHASEMRNQRILLHTPFSSTILIFLDNNHTPVNKRCVPRSSPKRGTKRGGGGRSRSGRKGGGGKRRDGNVFHSAAHRESTIEVKRRGEEEGRGDVQTDPTVGQISLFHAFAFWTTATKGAQSVGISERLCYLARLFVAAALRTSAQHGRGERGSYRGFVLSQLFFLRHTVSEDRLFDLRTFLSSLSVPRLPQRDFLYRSTLSTAISACTEKRGVETWFLAC